MKRLILTGLASLAMLSSALGRTAPSYVNSVVNIYDSSPPPSIDATVFINNSAFIDGYYGFGLPYETANTVYYTNYGVFGAVEGLRLDTFNSHVTPGFDTNAGTLFNEPGAVINCGGTNWGSYATGGQMDGSLCLVWATNIINRGTMEVGPNGLLSLTGQNVLLFGGLLYMEGFEATTAGMLPGYWGLGLNTNNFNPANSFGSIAGFSYAISPTYWVTNRDYTFMQTEMVLEPATSYFTTYTNPVKTSITNTTDGFNIIETGVGVTYRLVYLQSSDTTNITHNVYFLPAPNTESVVQWAWISTNIVTGLVQTNQLYLVDNLLGLSATLALVPNGVGPASTAYGPTYIPTNYSIGSSLAFTLPARATNRFTGTIGPNTNLTAPYTAYEANFQPTTVLLSDVAGQTYTNMAGRIEVTASKELDLRSSRISGLNYLRLTATNNFSQDPNLRIATAVADYNLAATNSTLTISNLLSPTVPRLFGYVDVFSTCWTNLEDFPATTNIDGTNIDITLYTNSYFVTMVDSHLSSAATAYVQNLNLHATNVVISDVLNILSNLTIDAYSLTITTNGSGAQTLDGQLNLPFNIPIVTSTFPRLLALTNSGLINAANAATFGAAGTLSSFVNRGTIVADGCSISATNFLDTGLINAGAGAINVSAASGVLSNGVLNAAFNSIVLNAGSLFFTNQILNAARSLTIQATSSLSDGGPASSNVWTAGTLGFSLPVKPPSTNLANLLGTTLFDTVPIYDYYVQCQWAGNDLGPVAAGYSNNAALGKLILDGASPSSFEFTTTTGANALYVDYLELRDYMTNFDANGNLANLIIDPGMKIYYAQLLLKGLRATNGLPWAEYFNGKNNGALNWVPAYAGAFSGTNMVYNGTTNRLNLALVQSCQIDSNGNGINNCLDPEPVLLPSQVELFATLDQGTNVVLSWSGVPFQTNNLEFKPSLTATNWQPLTNFYVPGPNSSPLQVADPIRAGGRFYRVRVD